MLDKYGFGGSRWCGIVILGSGWNQFSHLGGGRGGGRSAKKYRVEPTPSIAVSPF
jgi:hypothetical protein